MVILHIQENWQGVPCAQPDEMTVFAFHTTYMRGLKGPEMSSLRFYFTRTP